MADLFDTVQNTTHRLHWIEGSLAQLLSEREDIGRTLVDLNERTTEMAGPHPVVTMAVTGLQESSQRHLEMLSALADAARRSEARLAALERPGLLRRLWRAIW